MAKMGRLLTEPEDANPAAAQAALRQLVELGYIAAPTDDVLRTIELAKRGS